MDYLPSGVDIDVAETWIDDLGYKAIRTSDCVQRLKRICLLGTMQYVVDLQHNYSRYEHSLGVARLAYEYATHWNLSERSRRIVIPIALLHDIGHLPFSHASEVFFRGNWGRYHSARSVRLSRDLAKGLALTGARDDAETVRKASVFLIEQYSGSMPVEDSLVREIFHGVLSADTLDGISRAAESTGMACPTPSEIIRETVREDATILINSRGREDVERFLNLKRSIYHNFIYCSKGLAAEAMLTRALELAFEGMKDANDFLLLDDEDTVERLKGKDKAAQILERLDRRELFCSLRDVCEDKYRLVVDLYERLRMSDPQSLTICKRLERCLAKQMGMEDSSLFILHPLIQLDFERPRASQMFLPKIALPVNSIAGSFGKTKSFGSTVGVVFPREYITGIRLLTISDQNVLAKEADVTATSTAKVDYVGRHMGAYMTAPTIANFMVDWAVKDKHARVLDPASGDGVFLKAAYRRLRELGARPKDASCNIYGVEPDVHRWADSLRSWPAGAQCPDNHVFNREFLSVLAESDRAITGMDAIVGNPPYIRANRLSEDGIKLSTELTKQCAGVDLPKTASSWASYVICSAQLLNEDGRFAMVLPVELLSTAYAQPVREFLQSRFKNMIFVFFDKTVFSRIQQDVFLLLASNEPPFGVKRVHIRDAKDLAWVVLDKAETAPVGADWLSDKWTHLLTDCRTMTLLSALVEDNRACPFEELASIRLGQVTGKNEFFLLDTDTITRYSIGQQWLVPMVSKASAIPGAVLTTADKRRHEAMGDRCFALAIPSTANVNRDKCLLSYLEHGKREGHDHGHKCRTRCPWYSIPMQPPPDAFLTYMSGDRVRLVLNSAGMNSTNTIHNIVFNRRLNSAKRKAVIAGFYSSLTALSAELVGRVYGGGVLKLELNEARRVLLPRIDTFSQEHISDLCGLLRPLDKAIRQGDDAIYETVDKLVLRQALGLSKADIDIIVAERVRLATRRMTRLR